MWSCCALKRYMHQTSSTLLKSLARQTYFRRKAATCTTNRYPTLLKLTNPSDRDNLIRLASTTAKTSNTFNLNVNQTLSFNKPKHLDFSFNDSLTAFQSKTNLELLRGLFVFQLCGLKFLLQNQKMVSKKTKIYILFG